ncbi:P-loop containing nucleoside triphosphate hydrolase protein [Pholiota conissans]|uniref:RNA helicase n=1 Tax=Pholiota conissans TaxID=109636 RepID=A0A9P5YSV4_9AGAR|nr:P-loop containing nucleoside triphosphate hydrolase protein [Pholiota conissans]
MKFLPLSPTGISAFVRQGACRRTWRGAADVDSTQKRKSSTYEAYAEALAQRKRGPPKSTTVNSVDAATGSFTTTTSPQNDLSRVGCAGKGLRAPQASSLSFPALGLDMPFVKAMHAAFPSVQEPTEIQSQLIPEILAGKDVLLRDVTGSGKSFGLILALLNKPRMVIHEGNSRRRVITSLVIVPHKDLALQLLHWVERLTQAMNPAPVLSSIAQVVVRGAGRPPMEEVLAALRDTPPHILICTPQAVVEIYEADKDGKALRLEMLNTVVVDEVDYLVQTAARKVEGKSFRKAYDKAVKKVERHPGPTRAILDMIYKGRKALAENPYDPEEDRKARYESVAEWRNEKEAEQQNPQLVLSSATLRVHLKDYLFRESGWLNPYNLAKIVGEREECRAIEKQKIVHSVVIASDAEIKNVEEAVPGPREEAEVTEETREEEEAEEDVNVYWNERERTEYARTRSPFNPNALEVIATAFALDVPSIALMVIPSSAPVQRAVYELRELGVNAEMLDLETAARGRGYLVSSGGEEMRANPWLLVATLATTRGLDLPALSHVFVLGMVEGPAVNGKSVDAYVHIAGRVGRFGRRGRVLSVVGDALEGARVQRILRTIGASAVRFEHFD